MIGSGSAGVNAMVPGRKCECIVGVMRVRDFSTATEALALLLENGHEDVAFNGISLCK